MTYYANLSGTFPKIARNKTALSVTMPPIVGHYSQNLVGAEFLWTTDTYIAMIGSTSSIQSGSYSQNKIIFSVQMVTPESKPVVPLMTSSLVSSEPRKQEFYRSCCVMTS